MLPGAPAPAVTTPMLTTRIVTSRIVTTRGPGWRNDHQGGKEPMSGTNEIKRSWQHYIDGRFVDSLDGTRIPVVNPATGEVIADIACAKAADVDMAVAAARKAFNARLLQNMKPVERSRMMHRIARILLERTEEIALVETLDNGKRISAARGDVAAAARYFEYYAGMADKLEGKSIPLGPDYIDYTVHAPFGVSAQIVPWNFPLQIGARSIACALATCNTVVMKTPELSALSLAALAQAVHDAGVPAGVVNILTGFGHEAGAALAGHGDIDHLVFTGSVQTGSRILHALADRVVPAVMELGGKSAGVVFRDADIDQVITSTRGGIFTNAGQVCSASSRLVVERPVYDQVVERMAAAASALKIGPGIEDAELTPVISDGQLDKIEAMCLRAVQAGATAAAGGRRVDRPGYFMAPTVIAGTTPSSEIAQNEVFGPVLTILPFDDAEEALAIANGTDYGLCAGVYTRDLARAHLVADRLIAGQVFVNEWFAGGIETPFGGMKRSGYGREKGVEALLGYVQTKNVAIRLTAGATGRPGA